ncbi:MAG: LacI family transcriptional regulator [Phycisphaerae bacterium]|nr:LacI family transcriptional regulator [Phycisphaerae bacterium]
MAVTVRDIARKAAVSVGTVSRVLNNQPNVGSERKQQVLTAVEELNYKPDEWVHRMRKGFAGKRTGQVAMIFLNLPEETKHQPYMLQYIEGVQQGLDAAGKKCIFFNWNTTLDDEEVPHIFLDGEIDGIILKGCTPISKIGRAWLDRFPRVNLAIGAPNAECDIVLPDYQTGIRQSVKYLVARGHRRIAIINEGGLSYYQHKLVGYRLAMDTLGLGVDEELVQICRTSVPQKAELRQIIDQLLSISDPPTAILCKDSYCGDIYQALASRGMKIPDDVSIIGYDNTRPVCESLVPKLTSMDLNAARLGETAVRLLLHRIKNPTDLYDSLYIQGRLAERESVRTLN